MAEPLLCRSCGLPIEDDGGVAILCGPEGATTLELPRQVLCTRRECRKDRDEKAIAQAVADGIIDP
jgi:hypothetical protein